MAQEAVGSIPIIRPILLNMNEPSFFRVSVKGLMFDDDGKILLCREANGLWEILGGGLEHEEEPIAALRREVREETGLEIAWISDKPLLFLTVKRLNKSSYQANVFYEIKLTSLDFTPTEECQELKFFSLEEMLTLNAYPNVKKLAEMMMSDVNLR